MRYTHRPFRASLLRDWLTFRSWIWGLGLIAIAGPLLTMFNALSSDAKGHRIQTAMLALFNDVPFGNLALRHGQIIVIDYRPQVPLYLQGYPTVGMWSVVVSLTLGVILFTLDRQNHVALDQLNEPIPQRVRFGTKMLLGVSTVIAFSIVRSIFVGVTVELSPVHSLLSLVIFSFLTTVAIALVTLTIGVLAGAMVSNALLGWSAGFLFLMLPVACQGIVGFCLKRRSIEWWNPSTVHHSVIEFSPVMYTTYGNDYPQSFLRGVKVESMTLVSAVQHPWLIAGVSMVAIFVILVVSRIIYLRQAPEHVLDWFTSSSAFHVIAAIGAFEFGFLAALSMYTVPGIHAGQIWIAFAVPCYVMLWVVKRRFDGRGIMRRRIAESGAGG